MNQFIELIKFGNILLKKEKKKEKKLNALIIHQFSL